MSNGIDAAEEEVHIVGSSRAQRLSKLDAYKVGNGGGREVDVIAHGVELGVGLDVLCELDWEDISTLASVIESGSIPVSPGSPENVINVCLFNSLVLSSVVLRTVGPLIAPFEAAIKVKSLPVIPRSTSLFLVSICIHPRGRSSYILFVFGLRRARCSRDLFCLVSFRSTRGAWKPQADLELARRNDPPPFRRRRTFLFSKVKKWMGQLLYNASMSSFFTLPGGPKKRKRIQDATEAPKKRQATSKAPSSKQPRAKPAHRKPQKDESISGSEDDSGSASAAELSDAEVESESEVSVSGEETAASRRLRLAEQYLTNIRNEVEDNEIGFDAEEIDRDLIAERLQEDAAESKGRIYRKLADEMDFGGASHSTFGWDGLTFTSVAVCEPWLYTVSKDLGLGKWRIQGLPKDQYPPREKKRRRRRKKKVEKLPPPPRKKPTQVVFVRGDKRKAKDNSYQGHTDIILTVVASQDGKFVVTGGRDRKIIVWEAETLKPLKVFSQHRDAVTGLVFRRGTNQLYSCSKDRTLKVWSLDELAYVETLFGHQDEVVDVAALAQERCISVGARDRTARLWKVVEETQLVFRGGGSGEKKSKHSTASGTQPALEGSMDRVAMIDEEIFITGGDNGSLSLWVIHKKKPIFSIPLCHGMDPALPTDEASAEKHPGSAIIPSPQPRWVTALTTIPYSDVILSGSWDGYIRAWKVSADKKSIERVGVLGPGGIVEGSGVNGFDHDMETTEQPVAAKGVVNDIAVFERGDRGRDGACIIAALGKEHRLGKWKKVRGKNGAVVFEVPKLERLKTNGVTGADSMDHQ